MPICRKVNKDFFKKWSKDMAYVLGFFAADGYITVNKRGGQFWCIQIIDKDLLKNIQRVVGSDHKIGIRFPKKLNENILYRLQVGSVKMCNDLRRLGFSKKKTKNLSIPNIPKKYFYSFIRGYFDGDGNIWQGEIHKERKTKHIVLKLSFTSCSFSFLKELHQRLGSLGITGGCLYESKNRQFCRLQFSTLNALKLYNFMYNSKTKDFSGLFLNRKKKVFEDFIHLRL